MSIPRTLQPVGHPKPVNHVRANDGDAGVALITGLLLAAALVWRRFARA